MNVQERSDQFRSHGWEILEAKGNHLCARIPEFDMVVTLPVDMDLPLELQLLTFFGPHRDPHREKEWYEENQRTLRRNRIQMIVILSIIVPLCTVALFTVLYKSMPLWAAVTLSVIFAVAYWSLCVISINATRTALSSRRRRAASVRLEAIVSKL